MIFAYFVIVIFKRRLIALLQWQPGMVLKIGTNKFKVEERAQIIISRRT